MVELLKKLQKLIEDTKRASILGGKAELAQQAVECSFELLRVMAARIIKLEQETHNRGE